jgi:hypothetical protein
MNIFGAITKIFTDDAPDPREAGPGHVYRCTVCAWRDRGGMLAAAHHRATGHPVRGVAWPKDWPDAKFVEVKRG